MPRRFLPLAALAGVGVAAATVAACTRIDASVPTEDGRLAELHVLRFWSDVSGDLSAPGWQARYSSDADTAAVGSRVDALIGLMLQAREPAGLVALPLAAGAARR